MENTHSDQLSNQCGEDTGQTIDAVVQAADQVAEAPSTTVDANQHVHAKANVLSDAKRYRKRAQAAEKEVEELKKNLAGREKTMQEQEQTIAAFKHQQEIDQLLHQSGALDFEAARALVQSEAKANSERALSDVISALKREKPFLFRQAIVRSRGVMSVTAIEDCHVRDRARESAAQQSLNSGSRSDLLRYLRLRRPNR